VVDCLLDGKPLNTDFETGDLRDWTSTGDAFKGQPVKGPISQTRKFGEGKVANHVGSHWVGGYELLGDKPTGTLTSAPFKVTHPWAAFLLGGGGHPETRVELATRDATFFHAHGAVRTMPPVVWISPAEGQEIPLWTRTDAETMELRRLQVLEKPACRRG
jgi:hypothetical protein